MKERKMEVRIGNKILSLDNAGEADKAFLEEFEAAAQTNPATLQEFFERLVEIQRTNTFKATQQSIEDENDTIQKRRRS
jgi:hypothetical protein